MNKLALLCLGSRGGSPVLLDVRCHVEAGADCLQ